MPGDSSGLVKTTGTVTVTVVPLLGGDQQIKGVIVLMETGG